MSDEGKNKRKVSKKWFSICLLGVLLLCAGGVAFYEYHRSTNPIPISISRTVSFQLYYPSELPSGWSIDKSSFNTSQGIVTYFIKGPSGNLNITIQAQPQSFDFTAFYTKKLSGTTQFVTQLGEGAIGKADNSFLVGSLTIGQSWILASPSSSTVTKADIQFILSNLKAADSVI